MKNLTLAFSSIALIILIACGGDSENNSGEGDDRSSSSGDITPFTEARCTL